MQNSYVNLEDWYSFISRINEFKTRLIIETLYASGCSESELINLRVSDINFKENYLQFNNRKSNLSKNLINNINNYILSFNIKKNDFLFSSRQSSQLSAKRIQQLVVEASLNVLGRKITPQDIRKIHVIHALQKNYSILSISLQTGLSFQRIAQIVDQNKELLGKFSSRYEI